MARNRNSLGNRMRYRFDNLMAKGFLSKVVALLLTTLLFVVIVGVLASFATGDFFGNAGAGFFTTFMYVLGKGAAPLKEPEVPVVGVTYVIFMIIAILYCSLFTAILIGLVNQGIRNKVDELGTGQSDVLEDGHILVLGFNDATFVLLEELIQAHAGHAKPQAVVVLDEVERANMAEQLKRRLGPTSSRPKTRIICRTGSIYDFDDLRRCSLETARAVVVNAATDFDAVKAIMACSHILDGSPAGDGPYIAAVIHGKESISESQVVGRGRGAGGRLVLLSLNDTLARIMVHTSRQPGLSDVFTELFNYADDEFYIFDDDPSFELLRGKSIAEVNHHLQKSYAVGVRRADGSIAVGPPCEVRFGEGDSLIVVKEDDSPLQASEKPARKMELAPRPFRSDGQVSVLIIGVQPIIEPILAEYANYLRPGSTVAVVDPRAAEALAAQLPREVADLLAGKGVEIRAHDADASRKGQLWELLDSCRPDCVLVLADGSVSDLEAEDERIMRTLLYLRDYRESRGVGFSITSEMLLTRNKELAAATGPDDFIIGRQFSALLLAQIAGNRNMAALFDMLLSDEGFEIYMKPAARYVPLGEPVDLVSASEAVAEKGEVFIGVRQFVDGSYRVADINPSKYESGMQVLRQYVFVEEDYLVVLAEDSRL